MASSHAASPIGIDTATLRERTSINRAGMFNQLIDEDDVLKTRRLMGETEANEVDDALRNMFASEKKWGDVVSHYFTRKLVAERAKKLMDLPKESLPPEPFYKCSRPFSMQASIRRQDRKRQKSEGEWTCVYQGISPPDAYDMFENAESGDTVYRPEKLDDTTLVFEARFESGNLWSATKVGAFEYDLCARPDWNTSSYTQWYFFAVGNTRAGQTYKFNFVNMLKDDSLYNYGMMPLAYSVLLNDAEGKGWYRTGRDICYYRNRRDYTFTFSFNAAYDMDMMFFAYCYPYTFSQCKIDLKEAELSANGQKYMVRKKLCRSLQGRKVDLLEITDDPRDAAANAKKRIVLLSARCHPGESNSSWMFKGALNFLLSDDKEAVELRRQFLFLCVPMLNPDGVFLGNYRCSFSGKDLNRQWRAPSKSRCPVVHALKWLVLRHQEKVKNRVFIGTDLHGHSKKMNVFMYGCRNERGVGSRKHATNELLFPYLLSKRNDMFSFARCRFAVSKSKNSTYRVVLWREAGIECTYTMEASFGGAYDGKKGGNHFSQRDLMKLGEDWCRTVLDHSRCAKNDSVHSSLHSFLDDNPDVQDGEEEDSFDESTVSEEPPKPTMLVDLDTEKRRNALESAIETKAKKAKATRKIKKTISGTDDSDPSPRKKSKKRSAKITKKNSTNAPFRIEKSHRQITNFVPTKFETAKRARKFNKSRRKLHRNPRSSAALTPPVRKTIVRRSKNPVRSPSWDKLNIPQATSDDIISEDISNLTLSKMTTLRFNAVSPKAPSQHMQRSRGPKMNTFSEITALNQSTKAKMEAVNLGAASPDNFRRVPAIKKTARSCIPHFDVGPNASPSTSPTRRSAANHTAAGSKRPSSRSSRAPRMPRLAKFHRPRRPSSSRPSTAAASTDSSRAFLSSRQRIRTSRSSLHSPCPTPSPLSPQQQHQPNPLSSLNSAAEAAGSRSPVSSGRKYGSKFQPLNQFQPQVTRVLLREPRKTFVRDRMEAKRDYDTTLAALEGSGEAMPPLPLPSGDARDSNNEGHSRKDNFSKTAPPLLRSSSSALLTKIRKSTTGRTTSFLNQLRKALAGNDPP